MRLPNWLRIESRCLIELYLIPAVCVLLPWSLGYRWLRGWSRWSRLFSQEWRAALQAAQQWVTIDDPAAWARDYRTCRLVDHADYWLSRTRSRGWLTRHATTVGRWPCTEQAAVGVFFHWCAGMWGVRSLHFAGPSSAVLAGHFSKRSMGGSWLAYWYGRLRLAELARAGGCPLIYAPGTLKKAEAELARGNWVIGTPDVPPTETKLAQPVTLFDRPALFTEGLIRIARDAGVPLVIFTIALDLTDGRRELRIQGPFDAGDPALRQRIASYWEGLIKEKTWGFSLWPMMPAYFAGASAPAD
ncbi:hypothetical protein [Pseudomarimonas arenosa]|uniref:Lysophospholipid acyltransferase family protein n=1 Tax=Pseudomarimonas arenosa TaxID=2774145 RepID=A0AAW3ZSE5_9GAMM|nr:hypothetical protein [Pseudomarimonas arenosa]MBD8527972.1 hypothetical protein [Pseudomarimonas arenosa]